MREVTTKKLRTTAADLRGVLGGPGLSAQEVDWIADRLDALTAMVKRLMDEGCDAVCAGKFSYEASVFGRAVLEARALIGEKTDAS